MCVSQKVGATSRCYISARQRGPKVYALHAPNSNGSGKVKSRTPYEFGCKVLVATPATKPKGGQFVLHAKALHGNPFDGPTLLIMAELEALARIERSQAIAATTTPRRCGSCL